LPQGGETTVERFINPHALANARMNQGEPAPERSRRALR
jgi:hypothetical protein